MDQFFEILVSALLVIGGFPGFVGAHGLAITPDPDSVVADIKTRYESRLKEIFA